MNSVAVFSGGVFFGFIAAMVVFCCILDNGGDR